MSKSKYIIIVPVHKDAYAKKVTNMDDLISRMHKHVGECLATCPLTVDGELTEYSFYYSAGRRKAGLEINERADYYAWLPEGVEIRGQAVIIKNADGCIAPLSNGETVRITAAFNRMEVPA